MEHCLLVNTVASAPLQRVVYSARVPAEFWSWTVYLVNITPCPPVNGSNQSIKTFAELMEVVTGLTCPGTCMAVTVSTGE
jgi:hypothetical protein